MASPKNPDIDVARVGWAARGAEETGARQRALQRGQDQLDKDRASSRASEASDDKKAVQAGASAQPSDLPAQHLRKPGIESELELQPRFMAPTYKGSDKMLGLVALVTGGDSGIGRAVAVLFAREGADVVIAYLDEHSDAEETARIVREEGRQCLCISGDVQDAAFCKHAVEKTVERFGRLDVLVNNAAFQLHADSIEQITDERFEETFRTNVLGYFHMARASLPHLKAGSAIINTGSVTGLEGSSRLLDYSATKGAIHAFTKSLAKSVLDKGIRVNAIAPGPVWTPLNPADSPAEKVKHFGELTDMRRAAQPEELSPAYVFLASPACSAYITGIVLPVTGSIGGI